MFVKDAENDMSIYDDDVVIFYHFLDLIECFIEEKNPPEHKIMRILNELCLFLNNGTCQICKTINTSVINFAGFWMCSDCFLSQIEENGNKMNLKKWILTERHRENVQL